MRRKERRRRERRLKRASSDRTRTTVASASGSASSAARRLRGRAVVKAALEAIHEVIKEEYKERRTMPTWIVVDAYGRELGRSLLLLDGPVPDVVAAQMVNDRERRPAAAAVALVRVDDDAPRVLAWDIAGQNKAVTRPVIESGRIRDWRVGWVSQFDPTPRGEKGATLAFFHSEEISVEEASAQLEHLAGLTLSFFADQLLTGTPVGEMVPDISGEYDENERVTIARAELDELEGEINLGRLLNRLRERVAEAEKPSGVWVLNWPRGQDCKAAERCFIIVGCDRRYDSVFVSQLTVVAQDGGLVLKEAEPIPNARLMQVLDDAENVASLESEPDAEPGH